MLTHYKAEVHVANTGDFGCALPSTTKTGAEYKQASTPDLVHYWELELNRFWSKAGVKIGNRLLLTRLILQTQILTTETADDGIGHMKQFELVV